MQPFHKVLCQAIGENIGSLLGFPNGDFGSVARKIIEGTEEYYAIDGNRLLLDDSKPWNAFHILRSMAANNTATKFSGHGFDLDSQMSFVVFGYLNNIDQNNAWTCISAFDAEQVVYRGSDAENTFTGYAAFTSVIDDPVAIARKYGLQADKVTRRQTEIVALEIQYVLTLKGAKKKGQLLTFSVSNGAGLQPCFPSTCCPQNNLNADREPNVTDDYSQGYRRGSEWIHNGEAYYLVDPTTGAAVWEKMTFSVDEANLLYAPISHTHDDRYYTETESDALFAPIIHSHSYDNITDKVVLVDANGNHLFYAGVAPLVGASNNIVIGNNAGQNLAANENICIGENAGQGTGLGVTGTGNIFFGKFSGEAVNGNAKDNLCFGPETGKNLTSGERNTLLGSATGEEITDGNRNLAVGHNSGQYITTGDENVFMGYRAGQGSSGSPITSSENVAIGKEAGRVIGSGNKNTYVGTETGENNANQSENAWFGHEAGRYATSVAQSVFIGPYAGRDGNSSLSVFLGFRAGEDEANDERLYIANSNTTNPLIYGEFDNSLIKINGRLRITDNSETAVAGDLRYNSGTNKHQGYDGTSWNDFY